MTQNWFADTLDEQYKLVKVLKQNEKSTVSLLRHKTHGRDIVKRVYTGTDAVYMILRGISHPNIPRVYEVYTANGAVTVLEEFIDGLTVADILENGLYKENGVKAVLGSLCDALSVLHFKGIIHRDIKPENVMVDKNGIVKLIDYDAAKLYKPHRSGDTQVMGTSGYAAPEQFGIAQSDERTDIYALGILMNVMLTGRHPTKQVYKGRLSRIIDKCTQLDPNKRYETVDGLRHDLTKKSGILSSLHRTK